MNTRVWTRCYRPFMTGLHRKRVLTDVEAAEADFTNIHVTGAAYV